MKVKVSELVGPDRLPVLAFLLGTLVGDIVTPLIIIVILIECFVFMGGFIMGLTGQPISLPGKLKLLFPTAEMGFKTGQWVMKE